MADKSAIEWTEATLNPWTGCTKVSPGCAHCYIENTPPFRIAGRSFVGGHIPLVFHMDRLERMVRRRKPTMYFVNSLSDLFHEDVTFAQIDEVFEAMMRAPQHTFQVLTKRPERMLEWADSTNARHDDMLGGWAGERPIPNVWLGVTIENRHFVDRADLLRQMPAAVRFISAEPLLGPLLLPQCVSTRGRPCGSAAGWGHQVCRRCPRRGKSAWDAELDLTGIDWLIAGGESGPRHRPVREEWLLDLRDRCTAEGVAFFFKQWGGIRPKSNGRELDGRTWDQMPDLVPSS